MRLREQNIRAPEENACTVTEVAVLVASGLLNLRSEKEKSISLYFKNKVHVQLVKAHTSQRNTRLEVISGFRSMKYA